MKWQCVLPVFIVCGVLNMTNTAHHTCKCIVTYSAKQEICRSTMTDLWEALGYLALPFVPRRRKGG